MAHTEDPRWLARMVACVELVLSRSGAPPDAATSQGASSSGRATRLPRRGEPGPGGDRSPRRVLLARILDRRGSDRARARAGRDVRRPLGTHLARGRDRGAAARLRARAGIDLNALVGERLRVGDALFVGRRLCEPCRHLEDLLGTRVIRPLVVHRAGLRADILEGGRVALGDPVASVG